MYKEGEAQMVAFDNFFTTYPGFPAANYMYVGTFEGFDHFKDGITRETFKIKEK